MQPMVGGSFVLGGGRVLGNKEDYKNNDQGTIDSDNEEIVSTQMIVTFWRDEEEPLQDAVPIEPIEDLNIFVSGLYYGDADSRARLKLSRLVQYPNVIWSLMYHALAKKAG